MNSLTQYDTSPLRFNADDAQKASEEWGFNCGPGALCAVLDMTPEQIQPHIPKFAEKGYVNPTMMLEALDNVGVGYRQTYRGDSPDQKLPKIGSVHAIVRIQWGGPWTAPGVPIRVRYGHTHWIGVRNESLEVFDVNAVCVGGWISIAEWSGELVPWLLREGQTKADGTWWPTHVLELDRG